MSLYLDARDKDLFKFYKENPIVHSAFKIVSDKYGVKYPENFNEAQYTEALELCVKMLSLRNKRLGDECVTSEYELKSWR